MSRYRITRIWADAAAHKWKVMWSRFWADGNGHWHYASPVITNEDELDPRGRLCRASLDRLAAAGPLPAEPAECWVFVSRHDSKEEAEAALAKMPAEKIDLLNSDACYKWKDGRTTWHCPFPRRHDKATGRLAIDDRYPWARDKPY